MNILKQENLEVFFLFSLRNLWLQTYTLAVNKYETLSKSNGIQLNVLLSSQKQGCCSCSCRLLKYSSISLLLFASSWLGSWPRLAVKNSLLRGFLLRQILFMACFRGAGYVPWPSIDFLVWVYETLTGGLMGGTVELGSSFTTLKQIQFVLN